MKNHRGMSARAAARAEAGLYRAILTLRNEQECRKFFSDLCTPAELEALVDRWAVVAHLADGLPYLKIHDARERPSRRRQHGSLRERRSLASRSLSRFELVLITA